MISSKVAKRYAKALLSLGQEDGRYQEYGENLREFVDFCRDNQEFYQVITNLVFPVEDRQKILEAILEKSGFADTVKNFLFLLLEKKRIGGIEEIADLYQKLEDELAGVARAEVFSPKPLKEEAQAKLKKTLGELTSKDVKIDVKEDSSLIGGIVVKIGDLVIDGSIKAQLEGLRESLKRGGYS
ncbi:MAG: ATP synthase F1 subunit delta [Deltaproteobacteria bacterium]|nr:ATP synthase F1 subunit delta [Deltaproteobacteria bacterium]MBW2127768.1 ATP synthase F1 subunit delta [Deltaproteobacteria bacterium]MBW2303172.1 ATP synthase F1 subunit delta [Deltaproteobacteria bacterium]